MCLITSEYGIKCTRSPKKAASAIPPVAQRLLVAPVLRILADNPRHSEI